MTGRESAGGGETPATGDAGREAWALMFQLVTSHRAHVLAAMAELGLSPMQAYVLRLLEPGRPVAMRHLARALSCDASNVTGIVDRLEARGLIERRGAPRDRRVKMLVLTDEGRATRAELGKRMSEPPPAIAELTAQDKRALRDVLRRALGA